MEVVQHNQPATRQLANHLGERCCIRGSVLVTAAGRLGTQGWLWPGWPWWVEIYVAEPIYNLHPCYHGHFVHEPLGWWQGWLRKEADWYPQNRSSYPLIKILLSWGHSLVSIHMGHKYIYIFFAYSERFIHIPLPQTSLLPIFQKCSKSQPDHWPQPMNWYIITQPAISPHKQNNNQVQCFKFCPIRQFSFTNVLQGLERDYSARAVHFWVAPEYHTKRSVNKVSLLFPCQLSMRPQVQGERK